MTRPSPTELRAQLAADRDRLKREPLCGKLARQPWLGERVSRTIQGMAREETDDELREELWAAHAKLSRQVELLKGSTSRYGGPDNRELIDETEKELAGVDDGLARMGVDIEPRSAAGGPPSSAAIEGIDATIDEMAHPSRFVHIPGPAFIKWLPMALLALYLLTIIALDWPDIRRAVAHW